MQKYFEKIKERVCEFIHERNKSGSVPCKNQRASCLQLIRVCDLIRIVNQVAEEYNQSLINDGWIPCSEKTPEFEIYSVTRLWVTMHRKGCNYYFVRTLRWNGCQGRWEWDNGKTLSDAYEVVAWRERVVPAPYQPKGV